MRALVAWWILVLVFAAVNVTTAEVWWQPALGWGLVLPALAFHQWRATSSA